MDQTEPNPANSTLTLSTTASPASGTQGSTSTATPTATPAATTPSPTPAAPSPTIKSVQRFGFHNLPTKFVLTFRQSSQPGAGRRSGQLSPGGHGRPPPNHPLPLGDV